MKSAHLRIVFPAALLLGVAVTPAFAQRPLTPQQQITLLQQQLSVSQASALQLQQRLDSVERQLQQLINQGEVTGHRVSEVESQLSTLRGDVNSRLTAIENRPVVQPQPVEPPPEDEAQAQPAPKHKANVESPAKPQAAAHSAESADSDSTTPTDPAEDAYSNGYHLWADGKYDQAITALKAFVAAYPDQRRTSFAKNLIGRALLDEGQPRQAAEALLGNYRSNPKGERAPDSLYYLGQALMALKQPAQACKAYGELEDVYGKSVRPDLRTLLDKGKADANCS
jgi:TolA-binding protein